MKRISGVSVYTAVTHTFDLTGMFLQVVELCVEYEAIQASFTVYSSGVS